MTRVSASPAKHARHKKVLARTKGYRMTKNRLYKVAHEAMMHAGAYAFHGRKRRKRDFRSLWITRINAALHTLETPLSYSVFIARLKKANISLDRKILADLAISDPATFAAIAKKSAIN